MESVAEIWKDVPGMEGRFQVSNCGRVRSLDRETVGKNGFPRRLRGRILKPIKHTHGYVCACLDRQQRFLVHRLVMMAFVGKSPEGMTDVNHRNGIKTDNRLDNLEYCTRQHNVDHAYATGLADNAGEKNGRATVTNEQVRAAYDLVAGGMQHQEASAASGVPLHVVSAAVSGRHWGLPPIKRRSVVRWSQEQLARCIELRKSGMEFPEIARVTGVPSGTVHRHVKKHLSPS